MEHPLLCAVLIAVVVVLLYLVHRKNQEPFGGMGADIYETDSRGIVSQTMSGVFDQTMFKKGKFPSVDRV
jgi:hypothetical protein